MLISYRAEFTVLTYSQIIRFNAYSLKHPIDFNDFNLKHSLKQVIDLKTEPPLVKTL
jgi:hypothetical protein